MMGLSEMKLPNKRETEGYAHCGYYELSEIGGDGLKLINLNKKKGEVDYEQKGNY